MRRLIGAFAATSVAATTLAFAAPAADATVGCVTRGEFRNTRVNTTLLTLENFYETNGRLDSQGSGYKSKSYRACYGGSEARVYITYRHHHDAWRVDSKFYSRFPIDTD